MVSGASSEKKKRPASVKGGDARPCCICNKSGHHPKACPSRKAGTCNFCHSGVHPFESCPKAACSVCKQKGHFKEACKLNVCQNCGASGHKWTDCNLVVEVKVDRKAPKLISRAGKAAKQVSNAWKLCEEKELGESDAKQELDDADFPRLGSSRAITQILNEHDLKACEDVKTEVPDAKELARDMLDAKEPLPPQLVEKLDNVPLYKMEWTGDEVGISGRFLNEVRPALKSFKARAILHFLIHGYTEKSLQSALSKVELWLKRDKIDEKQYDEHLIGDATEIVWCAFKSRRRVGSLWEYVKLYLYDWWYELVKKPSTWAFLGLLQTAISSGLAYKFGAIKFAIISNGLSLAVWAGWWLYKRLLSRRTEILQEDLPTITDFCTEMKEVDVEIDSRATIDLGVMTNCVPVEFVVGFTIAAGCVWIPRLCGCNELNALCYRQLLPAIGMAQRRKELWDIGCAVLRGALTPLEGNCPADPDEAMELFLSKYPVGRRKQIRAAYEKTQYGYHLRECITKAFVKREWLVAKALHKRNPRLVSGKTDEYLSESGPEYYFWQKKMCGEYWSMTKDPSKVMTQKYIYTGGMTGDEIGSIFTHFAVDRGWTPIEGDYSRYDGHNEVEALEAEFDYYGESLSPTMIDVLRRQCKTYGRTNAAGHKFQCVGKVASGVINTSFGNTIRGFMILASYSNEYDCGDFAVIQLGDDNVIFVEDVDKFDLERLVLHCAEMGHKLEAVVRHDIDFTEYCSQRFWNCGDQYILGPKPGRVLSKTFICHDASLTLADMPGYMKGIALGFKNYHWVPLLGTVCGNLVSSDAAISRRVERALDKANNPYRVVMRSVIEVDRGSVYSQFCKIYGFDPRVLEDSLQSMRIEPGKSWYNEQLRHVACVDGGYSPDACYEFLLHR